MNNAPREIFFLGRTYTARQAYQMGMINAVVSHAQLEKTALRWAEDISNKSPAALRMFKYSFNLLDDGLVGQQFFAGEVTRLVYLADEAIEGMNAV